jgi:hypothetical protein
MKIRVTETKQASPNGIVVETYEAGVEYDMPDALGAVFVREGWGVDQAAPAPQKVKPAGNAGPKKRKG